MLISFYESLGQRIKKEGHLTNNGLLEVVGIHESLVDISLDNIHKEMEYFIHYLLNNKYPLQQRKDMEKFHYEKLYSTIVHALGENYYYLKENIAHTRRVIATSTDCISAIQCKCVDKKIHVNVFMRSSHYNNLLPVDLLFLTGLASRYLAGARHLQKTFGIEEWNDPITGIEMVDLSIFFGSLHGGRPE